MRIITVEEHFTDPRIVAANAAYGNPSGIARGNAECLLHLTP